MGRPRSAAHVKYVVGLLGSDPDLLRRARQLLSRRFGSIDLESPLWPFDYTDYYTAEMGPNLQRGFLSLAGLLPPDRLVEVKRETNALEQRLADDALDPQIPRPVNLDPGYLDLGKLILASTKDASHRIYLGEGIFAEVTLTYVHGQWQTLPWTYPDYADARTHAFLTEVRQRLRAQRGGEPETAGPAA